MSQATDERIQQWANWAQAHNVPNPLTDGDPSNGVTTLVELAVAPGAPGARFVACYNAVLLEIDGYGVLTVSEASMADKFLSAPA